MTSSESNNTNPSHDLPDPGPLVALIRQWGQELGFQQVGISDLDLESAEQHLNNWLESGYHGDMDYMARHGIKRSRPAELEPGTRSVITLRMDYLPPLNTADSWEVIHNPAAGFISRYALGRDYHKVLRKRIQQLAKRIEEQIGPFGYRVYTDSAPVMEKPLAQKAGLGWQGKHTNLINKQAGSWFFLGELYTDLALPADSAETNHCGSCRACLDICPTQAIVAPYQLDARRCISYLTIEHKGPIPEDFRPLIGNRIYGCDDCQLVCPWNKFAQPTAEADFHPRKDLDAPSLLSLFEWDEQTFLRRTEGSAIRRIGHESWLRNIAIALGNGLRQSMEQSPSSLPNQDHPALMALEKKRHHASDIVREHSQWAMDQIKTTQ